MSTNGIDRHTDGGTDSIDSIIIVIVVIINA